MNESLKQSIDQAPPVKRLGGKAVIEASRASINPVEEESGDKVTKNKGTRKFTILQISSIVCLLIALVFILAAPPLLQKIIVSQAIDQVIMKPENQKMWAHFPGDSGVDIVRNFTFFNITNGEEVLLFGEKPKFRELGGFKITELEDYLNITYLDNGNKAKFKDWTRFQERAESRSLDEKVKVLNMGALGYWFTLKGARPALILQQGLALLFTNLESSILPQLIGQGINSQFLTNYSSAYSSLFGPTGISKNNAVFLWEDVNYGLGTPDNLVYWAEAANNCYLDKFRLSEEAISLKNYFTLSDHQIESLMRNIKGYNDNLRSLLLENHYCDDIDMSECTGRYLAVAQMAQSYVTTNTPPVSTITPNDTICDNNVTCKGNYPEISAFYKNVYLQQFPGSEGLVFANETVLGWMNYNKSIQKGLDYNTAENCLLHIGNLDVLWGLGSAYDQSNDTSSLIAMQKRFKLESLDHTLVFWEWIKYLHQTFVLQKTNNVLLGISTLYTQGLYEQFTYLQDHLQGFLLTKLLVTDILSYQCSIFFQNSLDQSQPTNLIKSICNTYDNDIHSESFAAEVYEVCSRKFGTVWEKFKEKGLSLLQMEQFCDKNGRQGSFGRMLDFRRIELNDFYNCTTTPQHYCSDFELAVKQWGNSTVTLNPPAILRDILHSTTTFSDWHSDAKPIEYSHFVAKFPKAQQKKFPQFTVDKAFNLLSFDQWFSSPVILSQLASDVNPYLMKYWRYVCIFITLRGFTTQRSPRELLFGYEDQFLSKIRTAYAPFGGDPSTPSFISFNEPNITSEEAYIDLVILTGKDDYRKLAQNYEVYGYRYSVNKYTRFNGNATYDVYESPWKQDDYFYGTNAKLFAPNQFQANNISLLIPQLQRYGSQGYYSQFMTDYKRFGLDLKLGVLNYNILQSTETSDFNQKYYQTFFAVFNATSLYGLPLFITKNHFMNCTDNWTTFVDVYNENQTILYKETSHWDDTFIIVEPYTGVSLQSTIFLQNNYYHQPDFLFDYPQEAFLPIFSVHRSGNLTEEKAHQLYGPLLLGLKAKSVIFYVGIGMSTVFVGLLVFATYKKRQINTHEELESKDSLLGTSIEQNIYDQKEAHKKFEARALNASAVGSVDPVAEQILEEDN